MGSSVCIGVRVQRMFVGVCVCVHICAHAFNGMCGMCSITHTYIQTYTHTFEVVYTTALDFARLVWHLLSKILEHSQHALVLFLLE